MPLHLSYIGLSLTPSFAAFDCIENYI